MSRPTGERYHTFLGLATLGLLATPFANACAKPNSVTRGVPVEAGGTGASAGLVSLDGIAPYFLAGEQITWEVTFVGIEGGRARLAVGDPGTVDGRSVIAVTAQAESSGLAAAIRSMRDHVASWIDVSSGVPARTESEGETRGRSLVVRAIRRTDQPFADVRVRFGGAPETRRALRLPSMVTHDPLSAILLLRSWIGPVGARAVFHTLGGLRLWRTEIAVEGREVVDSALGRRPTIRIAGVSRRLAADLGVDRSARPRTFTLWLTDDRQRIPLRVVAQTEYGEIEVRATSYEVAPSNMAAR